MPMGGPYYQIQRIPIQTNHDLNDLAEVVPNKVCGQENLDK
jgi:hypothetical protein